MSLTGALTRPPLAPALWGLDGGVFSLASLPGLKLWLRSDRITGLSDPDPISTFVDSSGQGNDAAAVTTGRPLYKTGILNGLPAARFDGTNDVCTVAGLADDDLTNFTVVALATFGAVAQRALFLKDDATTRSFMCRLDNAGKMHIEINAGAANVTGTNVLSTATPYVLSFTAGLVTGANQDYTLHLNGASEKALFVAKIAASARTPTVGGRPAFGDNFLNGDLFDLAVFAPSLSIADRRLAEAYLGAKGGVVVV